LKDTCASVEAQTFSEWHHYVIGDGVVPTDYYHPQRTTIGFTRPLGAFEPSIDKPLGTPNPILRWAIKHLALGEFLCFLDDDNTYEESFLVTMLNALKTSEAGIALCGLNDWREDDIHDGYPELGRCDNSGFLVYSRIAKEIGFPYGVEGEENIEDFRFIQSCAERYGWVHVPERLVNFGINPLVEPSSDRIEQYEHNSFVIWKKLS